MDGGSYIQYPIIQQTRPKALSGGKNDRILRESLTTQHIKNLELAVIKSIELLTGDMYLVRRTEFINITGQVRQDDSQQATGKQFYHSLLSEGFPDQKIKRATIWPCL